MMTKLELSVIEDFLKAPWGTRQMREALDVLIDMATVNRDAWNAKDRERRSRLARKETV